MSGSTLVTVVACTYSTDRMKHLLSLIEALKSQTVVPHEVIVVVDHNPDLLAHLKEKLADVKLFQNAQAPGLSGSRNSGIANATGDIVAFIDDDAVPMPQWVEGLIAGYAHENVIGVGGSVDPMWEEPAPTWLPSEFWWVIGCGYSGLPEEAAAVRNFIGCNMSFRKQVLDASDGFRIELGRVGRAPVGCEETEFCIRVIRDRPDGILWFNPAARVRHLVPAYRLTWSYFRARCFGEGRSKAVVARLVGSGRALASERRYVARTLTAGVASNLSNWLHGDWSGLARASVIVAGLLATVAGYSLSMIRLTWDSRHASA